MELNEIIEQAEIDEFLESDDAVVIATKLEVAHDAADYARSIAPVDTGDYRDGINVHQSGADVWLGFDDEISNIVEYGSKDTPEHAVRARTEGRFDGSRA